MNTVGAVGGSIAWMPRTLAEYTTANESAMEGESAMKQTKPTTERERWEMANRSRREYGGLPPLSFSEWQAECERLYSSPAIRRIPPSADD